jgi:hypothetical protein
VLQKKKKKKKRSLEIDFEGRQGRPSGEIVYRVITQKQLKLLVIYTIAYMIITKIFRSNKSL